MLHRRGEPCVNHMRENVELVERFYDAFARRDYAGMQACYDPAVEFSDPIFTVRGKRAFAMWHMLTASGSDLRVIHNNVTADLAHGQAHWEAWYTFSATRRRVHNILDASFRFSNGKIVWHRDTFNFWAWSRQALGPTGFFMGWTPIVRNKVRATAGANLDKFVAAHPEYQ